MAEKWDEGTNDSPEVVYEGFSPPPTHSQGMMTAGTSFVSSDGNDANQMTGSNTTYITTPQALEEQQRDGPHHEEADRSRMCFVCCNPVTEKNFESIKASMNHSHAPLLVLLTDVLGYKLEEGRLHSQVVCKACYHLLDIIDELQQTLTESKTDVRTKFLETVQKLKLKYPRTDKMLKPRCLRCIQMSQSSARKRGRGRGWKGRVEDGRGRGRGKGRGRGQVQSNDGSDNDGEGQGVCEGEICKDVLPSKSLHHSSRDLPMYKDCSCIDMDSAAYECLMCRNSDTEVFYQYCESCLTCQGTFVPWGVNVTLRFVGDQCSIAKINAQSYFDEEILCIMTKGLKMIKQIEGKSASDNDPDDSEKDEGNVNKVTECDSSKNSNKTPVKKVVIKTKSNQDSSSIESKALLKARESTKETHKPSAKIDVKSDLVSDQSDAEGELDETSHDSDVGNADDDSDDDKASSLLITRKNKIDVDLAALKPILKIHEGRKMEDASKRKAKRSRKTLSDEFKHILNRPTLGKRKIKPTEKVKWLAESCMGRQRDFHLETGHKNNSSNEEKCQEDINLESSCEDGDHSAAKESLTEIAENENSNLPSEKAPKRSSGKEMKLRVKKEIFMVKDGEALNQTDGKESDMTRKGKSDEEQSSVKGKNLKSEVGEGDGNADNEIDAETVAIQKLLLPRKRGRRPGRRKRRSKKFFKYMGDDDFEDGVVIKAENGQEIDLKNLSIKNLLSGLVYKCPVCSKEYRSQGGIHYHLATHSSSSRYSCSLCPYKTIRHGDLRKHFVIHTGLKPYKCDECQQEFSTSSSYRRHIRVHTGEKPYKCEVCGKAFRNITTRKQHMVLHTGIKNFVCEVCGKSFALKHHYASHRKRHNGEMPFKCNHCDSAFKTHNAVKVHRKKEHPVEEAERIQQNRLRRRNVIKEEVIKLEDDSSPIHEVYHEQSDVLVQAMAATVETVDGIHYEYVDVTDPSIPLVSKMIKENWNGRDSVVLTITHVEEEEYDEDTI